MSSPRITSNNTSNIKLEINSFFSKKDFLWSIEKLKNHGIIKVRIGWKNLKQAEYTQNGPYLISGKHINNGKIQWDTCDHISEERYLQSPEIALKNNDIIFSKDGTLGNPVIIKNLEYKSTINATMMLIRLDDEIYPNYFFQILLSKYFYRFLHNYATKSGISHILVGDFEDFEFPLTSMKQQIQITNILEFFDKKSEFIERKYNSLLSYKDSLLKQFFPLDISNNNDLHFDNYDNSLKYVLLKDIGTITTGNTPKGSDDVIFKEDGLLWVTANDLNYNKYIEDTKRKLNPKILNKSKLIKPGSIFVTCIGIIGKVAISTTLSTCNQQINVITPYAGYDSEYIYYALLRYNKILNLHASQSVTLILNKREFSSIKIPVHSIYNQKRIAELLSLIDDKLNLLKKQSELTKKYKKGVFDLLIP